LFVLQGYEKEERKKKQFYSFLLFSVETVLKSNLYSKKKCENLIVNGVIVVASFRVPHLRSQHSSPNLISTGT
jgi:hypothetical protein